MRRRKVSGALVVVGDYALDTLQAGVADLLYVRYPTINRDQERYALSGYLVERVLVKSVAFAPSLGYVAERLYAAFS